jgi:hypothetical protein
MHRLIVVLALFGACVPTSYTFSPTVKGTTKREPGCAFSIIQAAPDEAYEELGTLKYYNGDVPTSEGAFRKAIASRVCDVGGHAVIPTRNEKGEYQTASVIKYAKGYHP